MLKFPSPYDKILPDQIKTEKTPEYNRDNNICNQIIGSLVGLAIGDALGASVEFRPQQYLAANPVSKMQGGGTWGLDAGKWTDDTSMALCLASSLIAENGFNPYNQMVRYKWWHKHGYFSSTGHCFDIGKATRQSIVEFTLRQEILKIPYRCRNEYEVDTLTLDSIERIKDFNMYCSEEDSAGNGALMRLCPVPLFYFKTPDIAVEYAGRSALLTHSDKKAVDACRYYAALIIGALNGYDKDELLHNDFYKKNKHWFGNESIHEDIILVAEGSFKKKGGYEQGIRGKGYVVNSLEAALWAFWSDGNSFEKGALATVNLGDDTDTTAAIYGQLAGAYYGYKKIPKEWLDKLYARELIVCMGEWLHFQGSQRGLEDFIQYPITSPSILTKTSRSQEQKQNQQTASAATASAEPNKSTDANVNNKSNNMSYSKQLSNSIHSNDLESDFDGVSSFMSSNDQDTYTRKTHAYGFYRNNSKN
ncbi:unnamed protein product [Adineta steineri]|uniref:ADP-ribosylglycohydrolase n=1 Tax=Adineta steineri TaxID=433720 RepID=A0A819JIZ4_9BILA|nr:unnamed protein product [Adineta steineri]CAF1429389.1 unnamed protein product [Adineta steineri]CAF1461410.1 unnamed protein product [Adineta steineri]CAF3529817.1 unnamed protein product [Adineta steineri]CAF3922610.1 unnamed protein product [Adineta steineri]